MSRSAALQFAHRLAALIGCSVRELPERVSWPEWCEWLAWYEIEPWGEYRADLRQAAAVSYHLSPYLPSNTELPGLVWPYWDEADHVDVEAIKAAAAEEQARWNEWERGRRNVGARGTEKSWPRQSPT